MTTITVEDMIQRLYTLSPNQLAIVDDFLIDLVGHSSINGEKEMPLENRPISSLEALRLDFWPADESVDDFLRERERWRAQDLQLEWERAQ